jgi:PAS domain S-box-containing protein
MAATLAALAAENESQKQLLRLVTDSQRNAIALVDRDGRYRFANRAAAERAGIDAADMVGKTIAAVLGPAAAERSERLNESALASDVATIEVFREGDNGALRIVQSTHVPVPGANGTGEAVLMVENDITAAVTERERSERILKGLVRALVRIVDARDPYAADHSARVARVALGIAEEMGLDAVTCDTAETAGRLMNLGKILVPAELLTKPEGLTDEEMHRVQQGLRAGADLLAGIEFVGPVVETLRQLQERWDGSGTPAGAKGEQILLTARIVAVANAFIAMTSDRAFRRGLDADEAAQRLMAEAGRAFDRRVVAALVNRLDNRGGRAEWSQAEPRASA